MNPRALEFQLQSIASTGANENMRSLSSRLGLFAFVTALALAALVVAADETTTTKAPQHKDGSTTSTKSPSHKGDTTTTTKKPDDKSTTKPPHHSKGGSTSTNKPTQKSKHHHGGSTKKPDSMVGESFTDLLNKTIKDEAIREKINKLLTKLPLSEENQHKTKKAMQSLGMKQSKDRSSLPPLGLSGILSNLFAPFLSLRHRETQQLEPQKMAADPRQLGVDLRQQETGQQPSHETSRIIIHNSHDSCKACCSARQNSVCLLSECPKLPSNKKECADPPICYPPCKLKITMQSADSKSNNTEKPDGDEKKQSETIDLEGLRLFDEVMRAHIKNETAREIAMDLFRTVHDKVPEDLMKDVVDVFKYFKDDNIVNVTPDSGQVTMGILGHVYNAALSAGILAPPSGHHGGDRSLSREEKPPPKKRLPPHPMRYGRSTGHQHPTSGAHEHYRGKPFCPPCVGKCESELSKCETSCPNNANCPIGQCVCK